MRYYSDSQIGKTRAETPEGFLVCVDVPIARTGTQVYDAEDIPEIPPLPDGTIVMERPAEEVFAAAAIASFEGKPVTNDHPDGEMVNPRNWKDHLVGHVQNVRPGVGDQAGLLLADLFINDPDAIADINAGKVEVSCGYDHAVEPVGRGRGRQTKIVGNHVALVDFGRCGPRCAIGDSDMATVTTRDKGLSGLLRRAFHAKDKAELTAIEKDAAEVGELTSDPDCRDQAVHIHLGGNPQIMGDAKDATEGETMVDSARDKAINARMDKMEKGLDRVVDALTKVAKRLDARAPRDDMDPEAMDEQDPFTAEDETAEERREREDRARGRDGEESEEEKEARLKKEKREREEDGRRGRDEFGEAPPIKGGRKILGELEFTDPLGDRGRVGDRRDLRREAGARDSRRIQAHDSEDLRDDFDSTLSDAEIILPGVRLMSFDGRSPRKVTVDRMCAYRRRVVTDALRDDEARDLIIDANGGRVPEIRTAACDTVRVLFTGAASLKRAQGGGVRPAARINGARDGQKSMIVKMQEANRKFWDGGGK